MSLSLFAMIFSNGVVEAVDNVRLRLEADSAFWFSWVKYSGYAVAIGCAMEAPETYVILKRWWLLKSRDEDREETRKDKKSWIIPMAAVGLIIIVGGIVMETYFEGKVSGVDALLRAHESDKITAAEGEASAATIEAGHANERAAANEKDAAQLRKDAEDEHMERVRLELQLQQRHLSKKQAADLLKALNDSPLGGNVVTGTMPFDAEAKLYAQDFHDVLLSSPKWKQSAATTIVDNFELPGLQFDPWGITIRCDSDSTCDAGQRLALAFKKAGFDEPPVVNTPYRLDIVVLLIGRQPTVNFGKQFKPKTTKGSKTTARP